MSIGPFRHECIIPLRTRGVVDLREEGGEFGWISLFGGVNNGVLEIVLVVVGNVTPNRRGEIVLGWFAGLLVLKTLLGEWMLPLELHAR